MLNHGLWYEHLQSACASWYLKHLAQNLPSVHPLKICNPSLPPHSDYLLPHIIEAAPGGSFAGCPQAVRCLDDDKQSLRKTGLLTWLWPLLLLNNLQDFRMPSGARTTTRALRWRSSSVVCCSLLLQQHLMGLKICCRCACVFCANGKCKHGL